ELGRDLHRGGLGCPLTLLANADTLGLSPAPVVDEQPPRAVPFPHLDAHGFVLRELVRYLISSIRTFAPSTRAMRSRLDIEGRRPPASTLAMKFKDSPARFASSAWVIPVRRWAMRNSRICSPSDLMCTCCTHRAAFVKTRFHKRGTGSGAATSP